MGEQPDLLKQLEARVRGLETELADRQERLRQLQSDVRASQAAIDALKQVIAFERASRGEAGEPAASRVAAWELGQVAPATQSKVIADAALKILAAEGPLHYRELTSRLLREAVSIGGSDPNASVVGALVRDGRFYRPKRGTYYVRDLTRGPVTNVGARHKRGN